MAFINFKTIKMENKELSMLLKDILSEVDSEQKFEKICKDCELASTEDVYFCLTKDVEKAKTRCQIAKQNGSFVVSEFDFGDVKVKDVRSAFAHACKRFYDNACDDLKIIGITGTNGKTTTSHIVAEMLKRNSKKVGVIGTSGVFYCGKMKECPLTTPDADFLHKTFYDMREEGVEYVVMEISAHAIDQKRIDGILFEIGVLTNVTQDHLDYFETFERYEKTKLSFMTKQHIKVGIVCADDRSACKLIDTADVPMLSYGIYSPCDAFAIDIVCTMDGTRFAGNVCDSVVDIKTNLIGKYNVYNSLAALQVCQCLGLNEKELMAGLNFINPVEGRFNVINFTGRYVVIDFAHSPDSLKNVLQTARVLTDKKVYVIFGCGGNRDKTKRPQMGAIAERFADYVCLTDDNPRLEKSEDIISDIEAGMHKAHFVVPDRSEAIRKMINIARPGDIIVVAGKGAEKYQEIGTQKLPYNDFDAVYQYFKDLDPLKNRGKEYYGC